MAERFQAIQEALGRQIEQARRVGDSGDRLEGLVGLARQFQAAEDLGWFTLDTEQLVEVRSFQPDQLKGLKEVGWNFSMESLPVSVGQLYSDEATKPLFGYVSESQQMRAVVPVAREVVINPNLNSDSRQAVFLPGSGNLSFDDQQEKLDSYVRQLRKKNLKKGTLDGVDFAMDHASVYAQFDFKSQRDFGRKLIVGGWARTIDETYVDPEFGPLLADVGRGLTDDRLLVGDWHARLGVPFVGVLPVASPAGPR